MATNPYYQPPQQEGPTGPTGSAAWGGSPSGQRPADRPSEPQFAGGVGPGTAIDVIDNADELWVYIDLPGFKEEEIQLQGDDNLLRITAERLDEIEQGREIVVKERVARRERIIPLPVPVNVDSASATYEDGVCKVTLPKTATERYKEIDIRSS